ncbi:MAG: type II toxin-antitoxin system HipA family toxin [Verrucomicrobiota bacterium]
MAVDLAHVLYQGEEVGVLAWDREKQLGSFEYTKSFSEGDIQLAPLKMPLSKQIYQFTNLHESFQGLPGLFADSLPDTYGNTLINAWLVSQKRSMADFSPVERLCYLGDRAMGALEYKPALRKMRSTAEELDLQNLVELANKALSLKGELNVEGLDSEENLNEILRVGTSAGGARAKAVIAFNSKTSEVRSGQGMVPEGFEHWLIKFDGITGTFDGLRDPQGYGRIEYAYYLMAKDAGIAMTECRLLEENGRAHFMTKRFDRLNNKKKMHFASLFGINHMSYTSPLIHTYSYEDVFDIVNKLKLDSESKEQLFIRMVFNVLAYNRDDHVKNFGFVMDDKGNWKLSPAYDVTYAYNPEPAKWTGNQQLALNGKRAHINIDDFFVVGDIGRAGSKQRLRSLIDQVTTSVNKWQEFAKMAHVDEKNKKVMSRLIVR